MILFELSKYIIKTGQMIPAETILDMPEGPGSTSDNYMRSLPLIILILVLTRLQRIVS